MRSSLPPPASCAVSALLLLALAATASSQNPAQRNTIASPPESVAATSRTLTAKEAREEKIAADAEKLYQLALDLKVEVDKSNKDTVSLTVVKRAAELEKLAKTLKQEMRTN